MHLCILRVTCRRWVVFHTSSQLILLCWCRPAPLPRPPGSPSVLLAALDATRVHPAPPCLLPLLPQMAWYSFQYLCEELAEQLASLHAAVNGVLRRLPA